MAYETRQYGPPVRQPIPDVRQPFYGGDDPYQQSHNNRQRSVAQGDMMNQELADFGGDEDWWRQYARGQGYDAYADIGEGRGGYRDQEQSDIIGRQDLDRLQMTPEERQALFLNEGEQAGIRGNPNEAQNWFDPEWYDTINTEGNKRLNENVDESGRNINNTYDEDALSLSGGYRNDLNNAVGNQAGNVRGSINRDKLTLDPNFLEDYRMTDRDVEDMTQEAALTQGNVSAGRADAIRRNAAGSGMNALALANGINELTTRGDQQANRAMLNARIGARGMQADRLQTAEGMRLDAEGNYAGLSSNAEMALGDRAYGAAQDYEQERLGTERDKGNRRYQIATNIADRGYDAVNQANQNTRDNARYIGEQGEAVYRRTDDRNADRAGQIAANRQAAEGRGQDVTYGRGMDRSNALSNRTAGVADARRADEKERRMYLTGQQQMANENVNTAYGNRIKNYGQAQQLANQSTGDEMQYDLGRRGQSFGTNFKGALGKSLGTFLGNPVGGSQKQQGGG